MRSPSVYLGFSQTVLWASTYYLMPALMAQLETHSPWSKLELSSALTISLLVSAATAPFVGKGIDAGYGRAIMMLGGMGSALLLIAFSQTESIIALFMIWGAIGACMAASLYDPCFSMVTRHYDGDARAVIIRITLIAGFAGTLGFPIANWIASGWGWQTAVVWAGVAIVFLALPIMWLGLTTMNTDKPVVANEKTQAASPSKTESRRKAFWFITLAFTLAGINHVMLITHLLPMLAERGVALQIGVMVAMCIGPMQVLGRFLLMGWEARISNALSGQICIFGAATATALFWIAGSFTPLIFLAACLQGACWGLVSIAKPSITRDVLGQAGFGTTSGRIAAIYTLGIACAPALGAVLWQIGGYDAMLLAGVALALCGGASLMLALQNSD